MHDKKTTPAEMPNLCYGYGFHKTTPIPVILFARKHIESWIPDVIGVFVGPWQQYNDST
jgi:hypothetical protein